MLIESAEAPDLAPLQRRLQARETHREVRLAHRRMIQMINNRAAVNHFARTTEMIQPHAEIGILTDAPAEVFLVETIDRHEVVPPEAHVTADDAALIVIAAGDSVRITKRLEPAG